MNDEALLQGKKVLPEFQELVPQQVINVCNH